MSRNYTCDRCKQSLGFNKEPAALSGSKDSGDETHDEITAIDVDLCDDCYDELRKFLNVKA